MSYYWPLSPPGETKPLSLEISVSNPFVAMDQIKVRFRLNSDLHIAKEVEIPLLEIFSLFGAIHDIAEAVKKLGAK